MPALDSKGDASIVTPGIWSIDTERSSIAFAIRHMMFAVVQGRFTEFEGTLEVGADRVARAAGSVRAASIDTNQALRDEHLRRSADFFDVERHPDISFSSTRIEHRGGKRLHIVGELTMRGVTRTLELDGDSAETTPHAPGRAGLALNLSGELNRRHFGLTQTLETGGMLVGETVRITLDLATVQSGIDRPRIGLRR
jgi:polyisoprenoid-binding protein YceI